MESRYETIWFQGGQFWKIPAEKLAISEQIFWETGSQSRTGDEQGLIFLHFSPLVITGSLFQWLLQLAENPRIQRLRILFSRRGARCQHDAIKIRSLLSRACSQQGAGYGTEDKELFLTLYSGTEKETPWHHDQAYYPVDGFKMVYKLMFLQVTHS